MTSIPARHADGMCVASMDDGAWEARPVAAKELLPSGPRILDVRIKECWIVKGANESTRISVHGFSLTALLAIPNECALLVTPDASTEPEVVSVGKRRLASVDVVRVELHRAVGDGNHFAFQREVIDPAHGRLASTINRAGREREVGLQFVAP
jgi:hypothetical protein